MIQLSGQVQQRLPWWKRFLTVILQKLAPYILKFPFHIRRYIILPFLTIFSAIIAVVILLLAAWVVSMAWKLAGQDWVTSFGVLLITGISIFLWRKKKKLSPWWRYSLIALIFFIGSIVATIWGVRHLTSWISQSTVDSLEYIYRQLGGTGTPKDVQESIRKWLLGTIFVVTPIILGIITYRKLSSGGGSFWKGLGWLIARNWLSFVAILMIVFASWFLPYTLGYDHWWWNNIYPHLGLFVFMLACLILPGPKGFLQGTMRTFGLIFLAILVAKVFFGTNHENPHNTSPVVVAVAPIISAPVTAVETQSDPEVLKLVNEKFKDQPDLIGVAKRESHFNQYERGADGKPDKTRPYLARLKGGGFGTAMGIMQIQPTHQAECMGHDIATREGNLDCALIMYQKRGLYDWTPRNPGADRHLEFTVEVSSTDWTKPIKLPIRDLATGTHASQLDNDKKVIESDNGREGFVLAPHGKVQHEKDFQSVSFRLASLEDPPAQVTFIYQYP